MSPSESMPALFLKALSLLPSSGTPAEEPARTPEAELDTPLCREEGSLHFLDPWSRKVPDLDELLRDGEPTDDEIYNPSYIGPDGPTKAA